MHHTSRPPTEYCQSIHAAIVAARLRSSRYAALRGLHCIGSGGAVRVIGRLPTHHLKQLALAVAAEAAGPCPVVLEIRVEDSRRDAQTPSSVGGRQPF